MMKRIILLATVTLLISQFSYARSYRTGLGLRGGWFSGVTVKHFISGNRAFEGIISTRWSGFNITGLYEIHHNAFDVAGLVWYYGGGGHIGFWEGSHVRWSGKNQPYTVIGIDGIIGIEYNLSEIPINLSIDWKPALNIIGHSGFWGDGGAFSIRYIF